MYIILNNGTINFSNIRNIGALVDVKDEMDALNEKTLETSLYRIERDEDKTKMVYHDNDEFILNQNY